MHRPFWNLWDLNKKDTSKEVSFIYSYAFTCDFPAIPPIAAIPRPVVPPQAAQRL
jgi:hypothetical protein